MPVYKHIFFDLDKTLWDFSGNTKSTFEVLYQIYSLDTLGIMHPTEFLEVYETHNTRLWDQYRKGKIEKNFLSRERFVLTLKDFGVKDETLALNISEKYIEISPLQTKLIPGTMELLEYLAPKYRMHIITNGFNEVQFVKLKAAGLANYFDTVTTSEEAGVHKPDKKIFMLAMKKSAASHNESIMIGDDISVDILGAKEAGMDQVYFNIDNTISDGCATYEIKALSSLMKIL